MEGFTESQSVGEVALGILLGKVERGGSGGTGIPPWGREQGKPWGKAGKEERCHRDVHKQGRCRRDPRKRLGREDGVSQGPPPHWEGAEETPQMGRMQGGVTNKEPPSGREQKGPHEGLRVLEGTGSVTFPRQERPQEGEACPDLLENEGETVTNPRPPQIYVTPRGLKDPTPEGREKNINKQKRKEAPSGRRGRSRTEKRWIKVKQGWEVGPGRPSPNSQARERAKAPGEGRGPRARPWMCGHTHTVPPPPRYL